MNKVIKICHITTVHNAFDTRIFYKECKSLAKYFGTVYLIAPSNEDKEIDRIKIESIPRFKKRYLRFLIGDFLAFVKALKINARVYHFHDPEFISWALILKLFTKAKVIYDVHENYFTSIREKKWIRGNVLKTLLAYIFNFLEKKAAKFFDAIIIAEDYYIENFKGINKNIVEVLNYPIVSQELPEINFKKTHFSLVYSGTVSENRGIWILMGIINRLSKKRGNVRLYIIGKFASEKLFSSINEYIKKNGLEEFVEIIGGTEYVKREFIDAYHRFMDLGLIIVPISQHYERKLPTKFFEYMLAGIPFIVSNCPRWEDFIMENKCGITVNPNNFEEITNKIQYLIENPNERKRMGEMGRKNVLQKYNWISEEGKLLTLYREIINS